MPAKSPTTSRVDARISNTYAIPWEQVPTDIIKLLKQSKRLEPKHRRQIVNIIIDDVLQKNCNPTKAQLAVIAEKLSTTYPVTFQDRIGEDLVGGGYNDILNKLCDRRDNLKRDVHSIAKSTKQKNMNEEQEIPKKKPRDSYGCVNWQPLPPVDCSTMTEKITGMKQQALDLNPINPAICVAMTETYVLQRQLINGGAKLADVREEFPYLFFPTPLLNHFNELVDIDASSTMSTAFRDKGFKVYKFLKSHFGEEADESNETYIRFLPWLVAKYFKEELAAIIRVCEVRHYRTTLYCCLG